MYKCTAAIMHFGNSQWKQRPREDQAEAEGTEECEKVAHLLGIEAAELIKGLLKPRIKVTHDSFSCIHLLLKFSYRLVMNMSTKVKIKIKLSIQSVLFRNRYVFFIVECSTINGLFVLDLLSYVLLVSRACQSNARC
jgi:hypothetical protein